MKLVRYGEAGAEKPGLVDGAGVLRDLSGHIDGITGATLSVRAVDRVARLALWLDAQVSG